VERIRLGGGRLGSAVLLVAAAVLLLRPWETGPGGDPGSGSPGPSHGTVVRVVDGDTLEVRLDGGAVETVRLIGVDTPETVKPDTPVQCFGPAASSFEHRVVEGRRIRLLPGDEPRDIYGRLLAYVWLQPNIRRLSHNSGRSAHRERFVNAILVRRGLARILTIPPNDRFAERFAELQSRASRSARGLWGAC
jgi:micrococcal nuclease